MESIEANDSAIIEQPKLGMMRDQLLLFGVSPLLTPAQLYLILTQQLVDLRSAPSKVVMYDINAAINE